MKHKITCLLICLILISGCTHGKSEKMVSNESDEQHDKISEQSKKKEISANDTLKSNTNPSPTSEAISNNRIRPTLIVSVGDSLTQGIGDSTDHGGYLPYLEKKLEEEPSIQSVEMVNYGVKGNSTVELLKRLDKKVIRKDIESADSIVVTIGGNDIMKVFKQNITNLEMEQFTSAKSEYETNLRQILDKIRRYNKSAQIYLVGVYNPFSNTMADLHELDQIVTDWNKSGEAIIADYDSAYFIEIEDIFTNTDENLLYAEDYFHPNDRGYELIATRIYNHMDLSTLRGVTVEASAKGDEDQR